MSSIALAAEDPVLANAPRNNVSCSYVLSVLALLFKVRFYQCLTSFSKMSQITDDHFTLRFIGPKVFGLCLHWCFHI